MSDISDRPIIGRYIFDCGAYYEARDDDATLEASDRRKKDGRPRFAILDTEKKCARPKFPDNSVPPCFGCEHRKTSGSKMERCFPESSVDAFGRPVKWRYIVTCYPRWEKIAP